MDAAAVFSLIRDGGIVGVLLVVAFLIWRGDLRLGREIVSKTAECAMWKSQSDMWRQIALSGNTVLGRAVEVAEQAVDKGG